ncbi:MAG: PBSX family phage terminase large subunit [Chloroflexota bacterium]
MHDGGIWEQQDGEPHRWFQRFTTFRLLGPGRSIEAVYRAECEAKHRAVKRPNRTWYDQAERWQWRSRAEVWDRRQAEQREAEQEAFWRSRVMGGTEVLGRLSDHGRSDLAHYFKIAERWSEHPLPTEEVIEERQAVRMVLNTPVEYTEYLVRKVVLDMDALIDPQRAPLVKEFSDSPKNGLTIKLHDQQSALVHLGRHHKLFGDGENDQGDERGLFQLPADVLAPAFLDLYDDIRSHLHTEYVLKGGRGSTKSSFISLAIVWLIKNNPTMHAIALRQVANTLRDSVYSQLCWAIAELELENEFKCITSPLEITYIPTGQKIYFRGADEPDKIKSIKPPFGYIGIAWFEELDQFHGPEAVRNIEQSAIRGGDLAYIFKSFNPPRTIANWANKYVQTPKANQLVHHSTYLGLGSRIRWLGRPWVEEAEHLQGVNPQAYEHEYLGVANGTGGTVFENLELRAIDDAEIAEFDRVLHGQDWGYYPDPAHYGRVHYDAARRVLYIFGELRVWKHSNEALYRRICEAGYNPSELLIADSAEPKSVADFRAYGANVRGAEKGPDSVDYSIKWLQGLSAIVIDPQRCPFAAQEFLEYEYEQDPDGNFISEYPDKANHAIDMVRYATNLNWRRRGQ